MGKKDKDDPKITPKGGDDELTYLAGEVGRGVAEIERKKIADEGMRRIIDNQ